MNGAQAQVPKDHPLMKAWEAHKATEEYANSKKWAAHEQHVDGSLWALFVAGWNAGTAAAFGMEVIAGAPPSVSGLTEQLSRATEASDEGHDPLCMAILRGKNCTCGIQPPSVSDGGKENDRG